MKNLYFLDKGNCQAVMTDQQIQYVYKFALTNKNDNVTRKEDKLGKEIVMILKRYIKYAANIRRFKNSVKIINALENTTNRGLGRFFPDTQIVYIKAKIFSAKGRIYSHTGYAIKQEYVKEIFGNDTPLYSFNWQELVDVQTELWKYGIGINAKADTWGPKNWCRTNNNRIRLVDTSHLCSDKNKIKSMLCHRVLDERRKRLINAGGNTAEIIDEYLNYISKKLTPDKIDRIWCCKNKKLA